MPNTWESAHGLNPNNANDAFTDLDGDRVPNLWEFARGTDPTDPQSKPAWDAIVDGSLPASDPAQGHYKTLQEAYDALPGGSYRSLVRVKPGYYHGGWDGSAVPKKTAWIADLGFPPVTIQAPAQASAIISSDETLHDGFEFTGGDSWIEYPDTLCIIRRHSALGSTQPRARLVNCILRNGIHFDFYNGAAGALLVENSRVVVEQCTFWNNQGGLALSIRCQSGTLSINRSVITGFFPSTRSGEVTAAAGASVTGAQSLVCGTASFGWQTPSDFDLTDLGYPYFNDPINPGVSSAALVDRVSSPAVTHDIFGQSRPLGVSGDLGAVEWHDTDADFLPDAWELAWFGSLTSDYGDDPDDDLNVNFYEYLYGTDPTSPIVDMDRDGIGDEWEYQYFNSVSNCHPEDDPDADGLSNLQEYLTGGDPWVHWNDIDADGLWDDQEMFYFDNLDQGYHDDPDHDGFSNGVEMNILGTDPTVAGTFEFYHWLAAQLGLGLGADADGDGLTWEQELIFGTNPFSIDSDGDGIPDHLDPFPLQAGESGTLISLPGHPQISLLSPPGAVLIY